MGSPSASPAAVDVPQVPSASLGTGTPQPAVSQAQAQQVAVALIVDNVLPVITMLQVSPLDHDVAAPSRYGGLQGSYPTSSFVNTQGGVGLITNVTAGTVYVDPGDECA